jgi:hypothetical protein
MNATRRFVRKYSAGLYAAVWALLALPFATLYANCTGQRIDTINGYQTLSAHGYTVHNADGSTRVLAASTDGFGWIAVAVVALGIALSLIGVRTIWLSAVSIVGVVALFLMVAAAGGGVASSKSEIGYWLSSIAMALAPAGDVRPWRRAVLVALATIAVAAAIVGILILLIVLTAQRAKSGAG